MKTKALFSLCLIIFMQCGYTQNHALSFDGTDDYVNLGSNSGDGIRSVELWFNSNEEILPGNSARRTMITRNSDDQTGEFGIYIGYNFLGERGRVTFTRQVGSTFHYIYSDQNHWEANKWYHVAAVIDPVDGMKLYIDGVLQQNTNPSTSPTATENEITTLGCWGNKYNRWFEGEIDEVRLWKRALSQNEILQHMCDTINPASATDLWCYYRLDEGSGSTLINYGEEGTSGSIVGPVYQQEVICNSLNSPEVLWLKAIQGSMDDEGLGVCVDNDGAILTCGYYKSNALHAGDMWIESESSCDAYVIKYNMNGEPIWMDNPGGSEWQEAQAIATDSENNIYVTGRFTGTFPFADTNISSAGGEDAFLIKYDKNGNEIWCRGIHSVDMARGFKLTVDTDGNILLGGRFENDVTIGSTILINNGSLDVLIAKFSPDGDLIWAKSYGGGNKDFLMGITTDKLNNIYFTGGAHSSQIQFGTYTLNNSTTLRLAFIVQMDPDGIVSWAEGHDNGYDQEFFDLAVDSDMNIYTSGYYKEVFNFGPHTITGDAGHFDVFIAKYNANHEHQWIRKITTTIYGRSDELILDQDENPLINIVHFGNITIDGQTYINQGERDLIVAKFNPSSEPIWVLHAGNVLDERAYSLASGPFGNLYFTGYFNSQVLEIGQHSIQNMGGMDSYIAAMGPPCPLPIPTFTYAVIDSNVQFTAIGLADDYYWEFGDGDTSVLANPEHTYSSFGEYEVCLTVTNSCGQNTDCQTVDICVDPTADFYYYTNGLELSFFQQSVLAEDYQWDFGDGTHSYEPDPVHTYDEEGNYIVSLIVYNDCGADQHLDTVYLLLPMMCNFNFTVDENGVVYFQDESLDAMSCFWDFGDGSSSNEQNPVHQYEANGTYNCCLTIENDEGTYLYCADVVVETYEEPVELNIYFSSGSKSIKFDIPEDGQYKIRMFDLKGNPVYTNELFLQGGSTFKLGTSTLPMGVYVVELSSVNIFERTKIMVSQL